jgi:hypothetical protein
MPYGLFTIPEISMVGKTEQQLTAEKIPYEVGIARYREIARGYIVGDQTGMLKLLFHRETRKLLGIHCIGEMSTEIIHIGQAVLALGGTIDYFRDTVFNYPTMAECYKVAAFDGLKKLSYDCEPCGVVPSVDADVNDYMAVASRKASASERNATATESTNFSVRREVKRNLITTGETTGIVPPAVANPFETIATVPQSIDSEAEADELAV